MVTMYDLRVFIHYHPRWYVAKEHNKSNVAKIINLAIEHYPSKVKAPSISNCHCPAEVKADYPSAIRKRSCKVITVAVQW